MLRPSRLRAVLSAVSDVPGAAQHARCRVAPQEQSVSRNERGAAGGGVIASIVVVLALCVAIRVIWPNGAADPVAWIDAAVNWGVRLVYEVAPGLKGGYKAW